MTSIWRLLLLVLALSGTCESRSIWSYIGYDDSEITVETNDVKVVTEEASSCQESLKEQLMDANGQDVLADVKFFIHRNGEPEACGSSFVSQSEMVQALEGIGRCGNLNKYQLESFFTRTFSAELDADTCGSKDASGLLEFCDMGVDRTVILSDHDKLVPTQTDSLPCRFYTRQGVRISSLDQLLEIATKAKNSEEEVCESPSACEDGSEEACRQARGEVHLYAVPAGRVFMFAPSFVGKDGIAKRTMPIE